MKNDETPVKTPDFAPILPQIPTKKGIYRLLQAGERLQPRDAVYCAASDQWWPLPASLMGSPYNPELTGPVRRFNK
ncbi:hypothetical protein [Spirosoma sp.]|uniref:hypothetical protein n=1 Tax=Spirosoma sp. TaxID=1899569 RepID=UPI00261BAB8F|nr:hypothetical protein [Spirosoma sp.]MCX6216482.1 hypothetical protein [Spirosoma sp.]